MLGSVTVQKSLQAGRAERQRRFLLGVALLLHQRNEFARNERKGDEDGRQHDAGHGKDDLHAMRGKPRAEQALARRTPARRRGRRRPARRRTEDRSA